MPSKLRPRHLRPGFYAGERRVCHTLAGACCSEGLLNLSSNLPLDLPAAMFITVHLPWWRRSELPDLISRKVTCPPSIPIMASRSKEATFTSPLPITISLSNEALFNFGAAPRKTGTALPSMRCSGQPPSAMESELLWASSFPVCWMTAQRDSGGSNASAA